MKLEMIFKRNLKSASILSYLMDRQNRTNHEDFGNHRKRTLTVFFSADQTPDDYWIVTARIYSEVQADLIVYTPGEPPKYNRFQILSEIDYSQFYEWDLVQLGEKPNDPQVPPLQEGQQDRRTD